MCKSFFYCTKFWKRSEQFVNRYWKKQLSKKRTNPSRGSNSNFFPIKDSFKKQICKGPLFVNCQEQLTYPVYGEYLAQTFGSSFLSKINFPF